MVPSIISDSIFHLTHTWTLISTTTPNLSGQVSNGDEKVFYITRSFRTGASPSDFVFRFRVLFRKLDVAVHHYLKKKLWNTKVTVIPVVIGALGTVAKGWVKSSGGIGNKSTSEDHLNDSTVIQNTEKSPEDFKRLVTRAQVEDYQLMLVWKALEGVK